MTIARSDVTGVVLAGGRSLRMGGVDKGLLDCGGQPLAARTLARIAPQVDAVLLNANRHLDRYAALGAPVVPDALPGNAGPLAGLQAAMAVATTRYVVTVPCDSPAVPLDLVARLAAALDQHGATLAVARINERAEPAFALVAVSLRPHLDAYLASGERKVGGWHISAGAVHADFDDEPLAFRNLNTPEELANFAALLAVAPGPSHSTTDTR